MRTFFLHFPTCNFNGSYLEKGEKEKIDMYISPYLIDSSTEKKYKLNTAQISYSTTFCLEKAITTVLL